jgi:hypothetical protein
LKIGEMDKCRDISKCTWWWCADKGQCLLKEFEQRGHALDKCTKKIKKGLGISLPKTYKGQGHGKVTDKKKLAIFERDGNKCLHCGTTQNLTIDHIKPKSKGGSNLVSNLQTLCKSCNGRKGDKWV